MVNSYPSIYNIGHAAIADLLKGPVIVEEKVDGSQFSFRLNPETGYVECRSKGAQLNVVAPEALFEMAVAMVLSIKDKLTPGFTYRGEYLSKPSHNALCYSRIPKNHVIGFDLNTGLEVYMTRDQKREAFEAIGLECVPTLFEGVIEDVAHFRQLLETESVLGGQKIEGVVVKPLGYDLFGRDKKVLFGKFVSEAFREVNAKVWHMEHRTKSSNDILEVLCFAFGTQARWQKAVQHLKERGLIQNAPQDIGELMKEVPEDIAKECTEEIKEKLFEWAWPQIRRGFVKGLPEWYKEELLKSAFTETAST